MSGIGPSHLTPTNSFEFGKNWQLFLRSVNEERIREAEGSLTHMLECDSLKGKRFLDIGSGSGLFSLAARRLGARVHSMDCSPQSVACARQLKQRYFPADEHWTVEIASVLDAEYLEALPRFDIVYAWGVLHHTGALWRAMENVVPLVSEGGRLFISIYNDQGTASRRWRAVKRTYNRLLKPFRFPLVWGVFVVLYWRPVLKDFLLLRPLRTFQSYKSGRGMSLWRDLVDWVGGYPFEVAQPGEIVDFYRARGFELTKLKTCNNLGCNEFVFAKGAPQAARSPGQTGDR
jgi:2-polyprenyl-6-hydroxyphenyl methylase/3-demethylubiquinone-9 3-methyltransferase